MKVLIFAPHTAVWEQSFVEALAADALRDEGHEIVYVTCGTAFDRHCNAMSARGLREGASVAQRQAVCKVCRSSAQLLRTAFSLAGDDVRSNVTADEEAALQREIDATTTKELLASLEDGIDVGRIACHEMLLHYKKGDFDFNPTEDAAYRLAYFNTRLSLLAAQRILARERPDRLLMWNSQYTVNAVWRAVAEAKGIGVYAHDLGINAAHRRSQVFIGKTSSAQLLRSLLRTWPAQRDVPCTPAELAHVTDHLVALIRGGTLFGYSAPAHGGGGIRARFGVRDDQQLLVVTTSSNDELFAGRVVRGDASLDGLLFPTMLDWIEAVIGYVQRRPELFVLVRVHPREFPNHREAVKSAHAAQLERRLAVLPSNVKVNWPADRVSLYDIAEESDVVLNAWSSAGKEMALLGLPVVGYCPQLTWFPAELNLVGTTLRDYFAAIERALGQGYDLERVRLAYRWFALEQCRATLAFSGPRRSEMERPSFAERVVRRAARAVHPEYQRYVDTLMRRPLEAEERRSLKILVEGGHDSLVDVRAPATVTPAVELLHLKAELRRLLLELAPNRDARAGRPGLASRIRAAIG